MFPQIGITMTQDLNFGAKLREGYYKAIAEAGGLALGLPPPESCFVKPLLEGLDGLILAGGQDIYPAYYGEKLLPETEANEPQRDAFEIALVCEAWQKQIPILAICRGMQVLNVALGGTLWQDAIYLPGAKLLHRQTEPPEITTQQIIICEPTLVELLGAATVAVNSHHHQFVREVALPLQVAAYTEDGVIEALCPRAGERSGYCWAVQWHPERLADVASKRLFSSFVSAAQEFARKKSKSW